MNAIKRITNVSLLILILGLGLSSCYKKNFKDHTGPSICPSDDFKYELQPSINDETINLSTDTLKVRAKLNEDISWFVTIRGLTSKSYKKYSGYGKEISIDWLGNPDTLIFFKTEMCEVEFRIACLSDVIIVPFTITNLNSFAKFNYLVYDGDGGGLGSGPFAYGTYATHGAQPGLNSPQGGSCFCTEGSSPSPEWYFGGYDFNVNVLPNLLENAVGTNPEEVYFNCFVRSPIKGAIPVVNFKEGTATRSKSIITEGDSLWHYVSFKLSEANVINPQDITVVSFTLNSSPEKTTSGEMCIDFVSFTNNNPFINTVKE